MSRLIPSFLALALLAGCSNLGPGRLDGQANALLAARLRWAQQRPAEYSYTLHRLCFCGTESMGPVRIHVRGDSVLERTYTETGEPVPAQFAASFGSVDMLFGIVADAIARDAFSLRVQYDRQLGIPVSVVIDYVERAVDEELTLNASDFASPGP